MQQNELWLKFIISGKPQDYLSYINSVKQHCSGGGIYEHNNRWPCDKGNEYKG